MRNKWAGWYSGLAEPQAYGDDQTYHMGERFLRGHSVEDWGCGKGYFSTVHVGKYTGIDGTATPFADVVADLREYTSVTEGLFMRHVLEHNLEWERVLENAVNSFTYKMVLILFTPMSDHTHQIAWNPGVEVPDMSFSHNDIMSKFSDDIQVGWEDVDTATQYGIERVYWLKK